MADKQQNGLEIFIKAYLPRGVSVEDFYIAFGALVIVLCVVIIYRTLYSDRRKLSARIRSIQERRKEINSGVYKPKKRKRPEGSINFMRMVTMKLQLVKKFHLEKAETTLVQAGFRSKDAIAIFAFFNLLSPVVFFIIGMVVMGIYNSPTAMGKLIHYGSPIFGVYFGLKFPWMMLNRIRNKRYLMLQRALSDSLDLLTVCAEAGLSMAAAIDRVSRELGVVYPEMAEELAMTSVEIGFYPDRNKALNNLAQRCDLKEIRGIATVLIQTEKYGTPIAQALRVLSAEFRQSRMLRAENKAARLPAMMTVPMILFILPTVFIIIMAPAVINTKKNFAPVSQQTTGNQM